MVLASPEAEGRGPLILAVNDAFGRLFDVSSQAARGRELLPFLAPEDETAFFEHVRSMIEERGEALSALTVLEDTPGDPKLVEWELAPVRDSEGHVPVLIGILGDARLSTVSRSIREGFGPDHLAETSSRVHFLRTVERSLERVRLVRSYGFAVIGLEIEEDTDVGRWGAALGEMLFDAFVWRVQQCLRSEDLVARIGRHRLAVLLDGFSSSVGVRSVIDRIREPIDAPFKLAGEGVCLRWSCTAALAYARGSAPASAHDVLKRLE